MNSYEISKDMCPDYGPMCNKCNANGHCLIEYLAKSLIRKSYHKVADDEIVIKKSEYEKLSKTYATINDEAYYCGLSVGKEETAREILALIGKPNYKGDDWYEGAFFKQEQIREQIADIYGIELED